MTAFQIFNLSIDFDYIRCNAYSSAQTDDYDDIDSYSELIIEKIAGDNNYTSEDDDDSGQDKGVEKIAVVVLYVEQFSKTQLDLPKANSSNSSWSTGLDQASKICKGYLNIISPPPKA